MGGLPLHATCLWQAASLASAVAATTSFAPASTLADTTPTIQWPALASRAAAAGASASHQPATLVDAAPKPSHAPAASGAAWLPESEVRHVQVTLAPRGHAPRHARHAAAASKADATTVATKALTCALPTLGPSALHAVPCAATAPY